VQLIKSKIRSAIWRLQNAMRQAYMSTVKFAVELLTERYWLLDYLPTFFKERDGVLLVRLDLIGDFVLWLDSAQAYRRLYPNQKITLAVNGACAELAAALPHWDAVISINVNELRTNYPYRLRALIGLRWSKFSIAVQPTYSREFIGDIAIRSTAAKKRIGYFGDTNNLSRPKKAITDTWYTQLIMNNPLCTMELNTNAHFVRELGFTEFVSYVPYIPQTSLRLAKFALTQPYIVVSPGASWGPKSWPVHNFAGVVRQLLNKFDILVLICGGSGDQSVCSELFRIVDSPKTINLCGKTTLIELTEIIRQAQLVLTNDSAPVHISAATGTPSVCILGGGHFGRFLPYSPERRTSLVYPHVILDQMACYGCQWQCIYAFQDKGVVPCIASISVAQVYQACSDYLDD
jgi:ADP-heptose:LPS heptosyltransferase